MSSSTYEYELYLCESSYPYTIKGCLTTCTSGKTIKRQLRNVNELNFVLYDKYYDGETNDLFDEIKHTNVIKVDTKINDSVIRTELYHINSINLQGNVSEQKKIKAFSLEYRMNQQKVRGFDYTCQLYTGTWDAEDLPNSGIVDYILTLLGGNWTVNYVSSSLTGIDIDWNIQESKILEAVKIIEQNLNCIFIFNTDDQTMDILSYTDTYNDFGTNTGGVLDRANYVTQYTSQIDDDEVVTRLFIEGLEDATIAGVYLTGQIYKDDFTIFKTTDYMSSGLISALDSLESLRTSKQTDYNNYISDLSTYNSDLTTLQSELTVLQGELVVLKDSQALAVLNDGTYSGKTYAQWGSDISSKETEISNKEIAVTNKIAQITSTDSDIDDLQTLISYETNLTSDQLKELNNFIREDTVRFNTDDADTLLTLGTEYLSLKAQRQYDITVNLIDVFSVANESYMWERIDIGRKINLVIGDDVFTPYITEITHNMDTNSLNATVSNKTYLNEDINYLTAMWATNNQNKTFIDKKYENWDDAKTKADEAETFINSPINVINNEINIGDEAGSVQQTTINRYGMYMRGGDTANGQLRILADNIVATNDNWASYSLAIDSNGIKTSGTFKLITENSYGGSNLVTIDGNGIKIYGSESAGEGLVIYNKNDTEVFSLDTSGDIDMIGRLTITSGSSGITEFIDAGDVVTANDLDDIDDGDDYKKTTANEKLGAGYAYSGLNSSGRLITQVIPNENVAPSGEGLYLGKDYLGYYSGSAWKSYMDSDGNFYLSGTGTDELGWDGSTLTVKGVIEIASGSSGLSNLGAGDLATLDSVGASNCDSTIISGGKIITGLLTADNIQAGTLTGRTVRTSSSGARIEMTSNGLVSYNSSDDKQGINVSTSSDSLISEVHMYYADTDLGGLTASVGSILLLEGTGSLIIKADGSYTYGRGNWKFDDGSVDFSEASSVIGLTAKFA